MNIAVAERAVERYYATITRPQLDDALSAPDNVDADIDTALAPAQIYERCTADERRLLNHTLFHRLYLADNHITGHDKPPDSDPYASHQPHQPHVARQTLWLRGDCQ